MNKFVSTLLLTNKKANKFNMHFAYSARKTHHITSSFSHLPKTLPMIQLSTSNPLTAGWFCNCINIVAHFARIYPMLAHNVLIPMIFHY